MRYKSKSTYYPMFDQVLEQSVLFKSQNVTPTSMISWVIHCGHLVSSRYDTVDCWYTSSILVQSETYSINGLNFLACKMLCSLTYLHQAFTIHAIISDFFSMFCSDLEAATLHLPCYFGSKLSFKFCIIK